MDLMRAVRTSDNKYVLIDTMGNKRFSATIDQVKKLIKTNYIQVIDLQIDSRGRLVNKKVVCEGLRKTYGCYPQTPLSWNEQVMLLFYGLARINQLSKEQKQKILNYFESLHTMDEDDLKALIIDNANWSVQRYRYCDTACRDKIIDFLHKLLTNQFKI